MADISQRDASLDSARNCSSPAVCRLPKNKSTHPRRTTRVGIFYFINFVARQLSQCPSTPWTSILRNQTQREEEELSYIVEVQSFYRIISQRNQTGTAS